jgi:hypothetical protein
VSSAEMMSTATLGFGPQTTAWLTTNLYSYLSAVIGYALGGGLCQSTFTIIHLPSYLARWK